MADMTMTRRTLLAGVGTTAPALFLAGCDQAEGNTWPGPNIPTGNLPRLPIGMNLSPISDYSPGFPFRNLMLGARPWQSCNADDLVPRDTAQAPFFAYDADGYPSEVPLRGPGDNGRAQQLFTLLPNVLQPGRYILHHDGEGEFGAFAGTRILTAGPGRVVLDMTHREGLAEGLIIRRSHRDNPLRNIRILAQDDDPATLGRQPFRPDMLEFCRPFKALRFMDWLSINNSIERDWGGRRPASFYTMVGTGGDLGGCTAAAPTAYQTMFAGGVAHEMIITLANHLAIDPWICLPHQASDAYVRQCATLYRQGLDPRRRVYVECSNELWNLQFLQARWAQAPVAVCAVAARDGPGRTSSDTPPNPAQRAERIGSLIARTFEHWLEGWQGADRARVTTVCAVQGAWADLSLRVIDQCHRGGNTDAVATGAYFGPDPAIHDRWEARGAALTADEVLADMRAVIAEQSGKGSEFRIARHAADLGLELVNYEGGQHIVPRGSAQTVYLPALKAAQTDARMYGLYVEHLRNQVRLGTRLFCAYSSIGKQGLRWGSWGAKESYAQPNRTSPKLQALLDCNS